MTTQWRSFVIGISFLFCFLIPSMPFPAFSAELNVYGQTMESPDVWIARQKQIAISRLMANISRADTAPGSVVASPQRSHPNYYYHWIRDAALTMDTVLSLYQNSSGATRTRYSRVLADFARFSRQNQMTLTKTGLGEAKFHADGRAFNEPWGNPQNDGPALRAAMLTRYAFQLIQEGQIDFVRRALYDGKIPAQTVIKADLEYVAHHWREPSFDLWEEEMGDHFYTRMAQRKALIQGAQLARVLGDGGAADFYLLQATAITREMSRFFRSDRQILIPTVNLIQQKGDKGKISQLDVAVILAVLHGDAGDHFLPASHPVVLNTMQRLAEKFSQIYPINRRAGVPGVAIGRYPEDIYDGDQFIEGHAWVLATAAFAETYYKAAREVRGINPQLSKKLVNLGDQYILRLQYHAHPNGSMAEQLNRHSGYMMSAADLTWSYSSFLTAMAVREGWR